MLRTRRMFQILVDDIRSIFQFSLLVIFISLLVIIIIAAILFLGSIVPFFVIPNYSLIPKDIINVGVIFIMGIILIVVASVVIRLCEMTQQSQQSNVSFMPDFEAIGYIFLAILSLIIGFVVNYILSMSFFLPS